MLNEQSAQSAMLRTVSVRDPMVVSPVLAAGQPAARDVPAACHCRQAM
jgi:hypothetical protein